MLNHPRHRVSKQANWFASVLGLIGLLLIVLPAIFIVGPHLEGKYMPVTTKIKYEMLDVQEGKMVIHVWGEKVRSCSLTDIKVLVDPDGPGPAVPKKGIIYPVDDGVGPRVRPLGYQDMGIWAIHPEGKAVIIYGTYHCHPFWETNVKIGEWEMK